jgi:ribosomal protein S27E
MTVKKLKNKRMYFQTEIVKGECPTCNQITTLVGITSQFYRCMECGGDLEQHVNGKISYLPIMSKRDDGGIPFVKEWK